MPKQESITEERIKQDIIYSLKNPRNESKKEYEKSKLPAAIIAFVLIVVGCFYPPFFLWMLLFSFVCLAVAVIAAVFRRNFRKFKVSMDDYEVGTAVVSDTAAESFVEKGPRFSRVRIENYYVRFENGETWTVPKNNTFGAARFRCPTSRFIRIHTAATR